MRTEEMIKAHPAGPSRSEVDLIACINACFECEQTCTACADSCLHEEMVAQLAHCIRTDLDCADVCAALGRTLSRASKPDATAMKSLLQACRDACKACGDECRQHASMHEHCRICAEACDTCAKACEKLIAATPA